MKSGGTRDESCDASGRDFVAAFAQRGDGEADDVQAVEEVLAKPSLLDQVIQTAVGGGDDADVDGERRRLAEGADLARLEKAQQLRLQVEAELADFVEKERAALGGADEPG